MHPNQIAHNYIAAWNEANPHRRAARLSEGWTRDAVYTDPIMHGEGHDAIAGLIGGVHQQYPGFRFELDGEVDGYDNNMRFSWTLGPAVEPDMIKGTDFVTMENGRIKRVTGFLDKVPAGA